MKDETLFLSVMKVWAATAWADGVLARPERLLLEGVIEGATVSEEARSTAMGFLDQQVTLEDTDLAGLGPRERLGLYRTACSLTTLDRQLDDSERAFLKQLAVRLELDAEAAAEIERTFLRDTTAKG